MTERGNRMDIEVYNIGNYVVNNYILRTPLGIIAIDTGYPGDEARFLQRLARTPADYKPIAPALPPARREETRSIPQRSHQRRPGHNRSPRDQPSNIT